MRYKEKFYTRPYLDETANSYGFVTKELNFVLIGKNGAGKSATGNTIVGREYFEEGDGANAQTKTISLCNIREDERLITVIDTPGLFDTDGDFTNEALVLEIVKTMIKFCRGIHLFLLVFKADVRLDSLKRSRKQFSQ
ncbi:GTPase IMAP family member 4 [Holothuria leucospilota]|uniref:GTPase IMAP family member 4 n=1 Tax=Holothuria leucospilota TaxID=206669 RepID=A0A9Q1BSS9_HOLLE|nr:GTPase IMAP family member 4 [Holothuria leucospilota]